MRRGQRVVGGPEASSAYDRYRDTKEPNAISSAWKDVEAGQNKVIAGHVLMAVGVVAAGAALHGTF